MASISSKSLSFSFAPIDARPHKKQKTQQRFELIEGGFQENTLSEILFHRPPFEFTEERYCPAGDYAYPITLVGRVALFDALDCLKILDQRLPENCDVLPLQHNQDQYSAFHWALQAPSDTVSEYFLENGPHPLACKYGRNPSICDTCLLKAMHLVEKTQRHKEISRIVRTKLRRLQSHLAIRLSRYLSTAWKSKDLALIRLCLEKGIGFNKNAMRKMLLQGIAEGFDAGVRLLLHKNPDLATCATPDAGCLEHGLRERTNRGFNALVNYANNFGTVDKEHWNVFEEINRDERSRLLLLFIKSYSLFSSAFGPPRMQGECQKTEEAIIFLLLMGADPSIPDKNGICCIDWIRNCKFLVRIDPTPFFTEEYVDRIIAKMVEHSLTVHPLSHLIAEYAAIQRVSAIPIIWNTSNPEDDHPQDLLPA